MALWVAVGFIRPARLCDERGLMVDPLKLFWVITNSTYLGTSEPLVRRLSCAKSRGESVIARTFVYAGGVALSDTVRRSTASDGAAEAQLGRHLGGAAMPRRRVPLSRRFP